MQLGIRSWADQYLAKRRSANEAIAALKPGQRVFIGSGCAEPQHLVHTLSKASTQFTDLEIVRLMTLESAPLTLIAEQTRSRFLNIRSFYLGSAKTREIARNQRFITPINLSAIPRLFKARRLPIDVALIQVSPPDDFGWMSLGISVDITLAAATAADCVLAQVNPRMPRVLGRSFIHVNDVDMVVEKEEALLTSGELPDIAAAERIGEFVARLIEDGSTIDISLGAISHAVLMALSDKHDLGIHSQYLSDGIMHLVGQGIVTNRLKGLNEGKLVASTAIGSRSLYEFINDNPAIEFHPSDYVSSPEIIARHHKMVTANAVMAMDLTGQAAVEALPYNHFSGINSMLDFLRGAAQSQGGKAILMLPSTSEDGKKSRILARLEKTAIVVPRGDVHYVVTEYGAVNLFGKSLQERAMAMISIAHPDFRENLFLRAKEMGLLGAERTLNESLQGIYPVKLEETIEIDGEPVTFRPAKPVDERRIQEHYYFLDRNDIVSRFFHLKRRFVRSEVENLFQIDYVNNLTLVAVVGEFGFGKVVAVGEYLLNPAHNTAEVAFSVSRAYQGKGLGKILLRKLAEAARENGIAGLLACTSSSNMGMINLFKTLPYKVNTDFEEGFFVLSCRFDEPR